MKIHMLNPLVSIIVPVYNVAPYLPACMNSLLKQTYAPLEIIFIDDDSTDSSLQLLQSYEQQYPQVRVLTQTNGGPGPARNAGLNQATGEYILFVDGDDQVAPETVAICMEAALKQEADLVCFGFKRVTTHGEEIRVLQTFSYEPENFKGTDYILGFLSEGAHRADKLNTAVWGKLFKRSLIEDHQIRYRLPIFEDSPFALEAVCLSRKTICIPGSYYFYFVRQKTAVEKSVTSNPVSDYKITHFYAADALMKNFLRSKNLFDKYRKSFYSYHNMRVLLYGGYFEIYVDGEGNSPSWPVFMAQLKKNRQGITMHRKGLYRGYRKRIVFLNIGALLSVVSPGAAHRFFTWYEKTLAPK
jgi:glycosyltransferase involved in cell wall biosynthesis